MTGIVHSRGTGASIRTPTVVFSLFAALIGIFAVVGGMQVYQSYAEAMRNVDLRANSASQVVAANIEWVMETARQVLQRVDDSLPDIDGPLPPDAADKLSRSVSSIPGNPKIYVVDAGAKTLLTTDPDFQDIDISDREYFIKAKEGNAFWVSSLLVSRLNGEQIFTVSKRIERDGEFAGTVILSLSSGLMEKIWGSLRLDELSTVGLFRNDGLLVSRFPLPEGPMDLSAYVLFTDYLPKAAEGTYEAVSPADSVHRMVSYRRVPGTNLVALASVAIEPALRGFWNGVATRVGFGVPVLLMLLTVVLWVRRLLSRDEERSKALAEAVDHNRLLMREIHHRVKNNLTSMVALVNVSVTDADSRRALADRISAMANVYESTYAEGDHFEKLDAAGYIKRIVEGIRENFEVKVSIVYRLDSLLVERDTAMPLALVVNEVVTNAFKYAFDDMVDGRLEIELHRTSEVQAELIISDNGRGFDSASVRKGMGTRLLNGFAQQLKGEFQYTGEKGARFELSFPVPNGSEAKAADL